MFPENSLERPEKGLLLASSGLAVHENEGLDLDIHWTIFSADAELVSTPHNVHSEQ